MARYALLIRGVNVGKGNSLPMAELRAMLARLDCTRARTLGHSGNAAFDASATAKDLLCGVESELERFMGRPVPAILRTSRQMRAVVAGNPFPQEASDARNLCVTFLSTAPSRSSLAPLLESPWTPELVEAVGKHVYSWHPSGQSRSPLAEAISKLQLRGTMTTRNWNTVLKLARLLDEE